MINKKILGLIGLSARARKVSFGADSVETRNKEEKSEFDYCSRKFFRKNERKVSKIK